MMRFSTKVCCLLLLFCIFSGTLGSGADENPGPVSKSPSSVTMGIITTFVQSGMANGTKLFYTQDKECSIPQDKWVGEVTVVAGKATMSVLPTSDALVLICQELKVDDPPVFVRSIEVVIASTVPKTALSGKKTTMTIHGAELSALSAAKSGAYIINEESFTCVGPAPKASEAVEIPANSNTTATFPFSFSKPGFYTVCLYTDEKATTAGNVKVVSPPEITEETINPGTPFTQDQLGIDTSVLKSAFLSKKSTCDDPLPSSVFTEGYYPTYDEKATFYVCGTLAEDSSITYTTDEPTLTITNWKISPTSVLSRYNQIVGEPVSTPISLNFRVSSTKSFFSTDSSCVPVMADASQIADTMSTTASAVGVNGLVFLCITPTDEAATIAVAAYLSVSPPYVEEISSALMSTQTFYGQLKLWASKSGESLYSLQAGADAKFPYASYYVSNDRDAFLSSDNCASVLEETSKVAIPAKNLVTITTGDLSTTITEAQLCVGTPAGVGVAAVFPYTTSPVYPTSYVTGFTTAMYAPGHTKATLKVFPNGTGKCPSSGTPTATVATNEYGVGPLNLGSNPTEAKPPGAYIVCNDETVVTTIQVTEPPQYSIVGNVFVVGVPSVMMLEKQLTSDLVILGFTSTADCADASTEYGSWEVVDSKAIKVTATKAASPLHLCAKVQHNQTMSLLQGSQSTLAFVALDSSPLNGEVKTCGSTIKHCAAPASASGETGDVLALISGECCNSADRQNVLGKTSIDSDTCELSLNSTDFGKYPAHATFNLCAWNTTDESYCVTMERDITVRGCGSSSSNTNTIIIVVCVVVPCVVLFSLIGYFVWRRWFKKGPDLEKEEEGEKGEEGEEDRLGGNVQ